jgi:flagellar motor protein MotB
MTYSDVITLLMTFFILLLTFASNEPEFFAQVQVVSFGGGGTSGVIGPVDELLDKDAVILRDRPNAARLTTRGSELPPTQSDPAQTTLNRGLQSLQNTDELADEERVRMQSPMSMMRDAQGQPTSHAIQQMKMLAMQMKNLPMDVEFRVGNQQDSDFCIDLGLMLIEKFGIDPGRVAVGITHGNAVPAGQMETIMARTEPLF